MTGFQHRKASKGLGCRNCYKGYESITITIKYLVTLRDRAGRNEEEVSFKQGSTLEDVTGWLQKRYGIALPDPHIMAILNGRGWEQFPAKLGTKLCEGDVICLFPPVSGG